jgi:hypothetical protein
MDRWETHDMNEFHLSQEILGNCKGRMPYTQNCFDMLYYTSSAMARFLYDYLFPSYAVETTL